MSPIVSKIFLAAMPLLAISSSSLLSSVSADTWSTAPKPTTRWYAPPPVAKWTPPPTSPYTPVTPHPGCQKQSICSQIYQEGVKDRSCFVRNPSTGKTEEQCYNPLCHVCVNDQLCPANYPMLCGNGCYSPDEYTCDNGQLVSTGKSNTLSVWEYCPGSGSSYAGQTPDSSYSFPPLPAESSQQYSGWQSTQCPSYPATTDICSQIYQEGQQDKSCHVRNPSTKATELQCYNPMCMTCINNQLCPNNAPLECNGACYSAAEYKCNAGKLESTGGKNTEKLWDYCPGSGSPLAGQTPGQTAYTQQPGY